MTGDSADSTRWGWIKLSYSLSGGAPFVVDSSTGRITLTGALDYNTTPNYTLIATVTDAGGLYDTAAVTINVTHVNAPPVFSSAAYTLSVAENSANGTSAGGVSATDPDPGDTLTYSLSGSGPFAIDSAIGAITVTGALDYETTTSYSFTATATDNGGASDTATVTISVTNVNEPPALGSASYTFSAAEDKAVGDAVGSVSATDPDAGDTRTYSLGGSSRFAINSSTGAITVSGALDYESAISYTLTATVTDAGGLTDTASVTINVSNVNERPNFDSASYTFSVPENSLVGTAVGAVSATDPDAGDTLTLTYSLSGTGPFRIVDPTVDPTTGAILTSATITVSGPINYEAVAQYTLTAKARDRAGLEHTASVTIDVTNVNEAPVFKPRTYIFPVPENSANGTPVGTVKATDPDAGDAITFSLSAGFPFTIDSTDSTSGAITVNGALDYETTPSYTMTARATDLGGLSHAAVVTVNVTDVNEAPVVTAPANQSHTEDRHIGIGRT